jgi:hypothetical protein
MLEAEKKEADRPAFDEALARGVKYESQGDGALAARCYLGAAKEYPGEPRAKATRERGEMLWRQGYGDLPLP